VPQAPETHLDSDQIAVLMFRIAVRRAEAASDGVATTLPIHLAL
jgi:hypothetical protein